jgi:hypothetical protein
MKRPKLDLDHHKMPVSLEPGGNSRRYGVLGVSLDEEKSSSWRGATAILHAASHHAMLLTAMKAKMMGLGSREHN